MLNKDRIKNQCAQREYAKLYTVFAALPPKFLIQFRVFLRILCVCKVSQLKEYNQLQLIFIDLALRNLLPLAEILWMEYEHMRYLNTVVIERECARQKLKSLICLSLILRV